MAAAARDCPCQRYTAHSRLTAPRRVAVQRPSRRSPLSNGSGHHLRATEGKPRRPACAAVQVGSAAAVYVPCLSCAKSRQQKRPACAAVQVGSAAAVYFPCLSCAKPRQQKRRPSEESHSADEANEGHSRSGRRR
jgi:hypothetical protein